MKVVSLQTARNGSLEVKNKNKYVVNGYPLFLHNLINLNKSKYVNSVYFSTDIPEVYDYLDICDYHIIDRPKELCESTSSHYDAMLHGVNKILEIEDFDYLVITLGNSLGALPEDIDKSLEFLEDNDDYDSCESVSEHSYHNPMRSYNIENDTIKPIFNSTMDKSNDRRTMGKVYFFNGSFFVIRKEVFLRNDGNPPFKWGGKKIKPIVQPQQYIELDSEWQKIIFDSHGNKKSSKG